MDNFNNYFNARTIAHYYTWCAIFQLIWSLAVLGFVMFLLNFVGNNSVLLFVLLIFVKPYSKLGLKSKSSESSTDEEKTTQE